MVKQSSKTGPAFRRRLMGTVGKQQKEIEQHRRSIRRINSKIAELEAKINHGRKGKRSKGSDEEE